ncbi:hypothetical protein Ddc_09033 [Ditylenchus destructor]|nr:hypothetical protein Ddc_09033 [Ditylenchus destructor]
MNIRFGPNGGRDGAIPTASAKLRRSLVDVSVNADEAVIEAVNLIRSARIQMETLTNTINERINITTADVGDKIGTIIGDVQTITHNIADSTQNFNQPFLSSMFLYGAFLFMIIFLTILVVILLLIILKTQRYYKKRKGSRSASTSLLGERKSPSGGKGFRTKMQRWRRGKRAKSSSPPAAVIGRRNTATDFPPLDYSLSPTLPIRKKTSTDTLV